MIEFDLGTYLASCPPIEELVGGQVYAESADQGVQAPYIVYRLLPGAERHYHTQGASGLVEASIEINCHGKTIDSARAIYDAVRNEVDGFRGEWDATTVNLAKLGTPSSRSVIPTHGSEAGSPAITARLDVFYYESTPTLGGPA